MMTILPKHGGAIHPSDALGVNDILCGEGKKYRKRQGNVMYHLFVRAYVDQCPQQVRRKNKNKIIKSIVQSLRMTQPPARFLLKSEDGYFYEIGDKKAYVKTGQIVRDYVHKIEKNDKEKNYRASQYASIIEVVLFFITLYITAYFTL
eukprot:30626_1